MTNYHIYNYILYLLPKVQHMKPMLFILFTVPIHFSPIGYLVSKEYALPKSINFNIFDF